MKHLISLVLGIVMCLTLAIPAFALSTDPVTPEEPKDYGDPVHETTYYDEDIDAEVTERIYFVPGDSITYDGKSGNGWYKNEKTFHWGASTNTTTTFAKGYFVWGDGEVSVSSPSGGYDWFPSASTITKEELSSGTGKYGYVFNNFAYVTYTFKFTAEMGGSYDNSVTIRVSESGNLI